MKTTISKYATTLVAVTLLAFSMTGCWQPRTDIGSKSFVFETLSPCHLAVNNYQCVSDSLTESDALRPQIFKCCVVDGKIQNIDNLILAGPNIDNGWFFGQEIGDTAYYRRLPVVHPEDRYFKEKYTKYYIPDRALYWEFQSISIVSNNASFGSDYPVGSDLTPIVIFGFPSLLEFVQNGYKGPYTTEHLIRANDKEAWANLKVFETGKPKLIIERLPTEVIGGGCPRLQSA